MNKLSFLLLCWRAYNGDPQAIVKVLQILREKVSSL